MMTFIDIFALLVLAVLLIAAVAIWIILAMLPGKIARQRDHPQAEAINVCGWWGGLTLGLLLPVAYVWAYTNPRWRENEPQGRDKLARSGAEEVLK